MGVNPKRNRVNSSFTGGARKLFYCQLSGVGLVFSVGYSYMGRMGLKPSKVLGLVYPSAEADGNVLMKY
jgi:hypothetical protein